MRIAVEGCAHGELEKIYHTIQRIEKARNEKVDVLLCCGDFQSTRNLDDLQTMAVPKKYRKICTFYKYYSGELVAPMLTIFIGGNHEASNFLQELPYGGWVAPNIYYLGYAGVVRINGIRVAGISGIYKGHDYLRGRHEFSPYTEATRKSVYHVRQLEVFRLKQMSGDRVDIFLSHDWPRDIYNEGDKAKLLRLKPHFRDDIDDGKLGSRPSADLLNLLKPVRWFAAHLHCKFSALKTFKEDAFVLDKEGTPDEEYVEKEEEENNDNMCTGEKRVFYRKQYEEKYTKFLALDKCLPKRRFLQLFDYESADYTDDSGEICFEYDLEWLAILRVTNHLTNVKTSPYYLPREGYCDSKARSNFTPTAEELEEVRQRFGGNLRVPENFSRTVEPYNAATDASRIAYDLPQPKAKINPQSKSFCDTLGIDDPLSLAMIIGGHELKYSTELNSSANTTASTFNNSSAEVLVGDISSASHSSSSFGFGFLDASSSSASFVEPSALKRKIPNTSLCLPQPNANTTAFNISPLALPVIVKPITSMHTEEVQLDDSSSDDNETTEKILVSPPIKKLRRRNQNIYKDDDEDEGNVAL